MCFCQKRSVNKRTVEISGEVVPARATVCAFENIPRANVNRIRVEWICVKVRVVSKLPAVHSGKDVIRAKRCATVGADGQTNFGSVRSTTTGIDINLLWVSRRNRNADVSDPQRTESVSKTRIIDFGPG